MATTIKNSQLRGPLGGTGSDGNKWYTGTAMTSTSTTTSYTYSGSGISGALVGDMYLNTSSYRIYQCTLAGNAATAKWLYKCYIKGVTGATGAQGATGTCGGVWYSGTDVTGMAQTGTIFPGSGISGAVVGDMYLNTTTGNVYRCTFAGNAATAKWSYQMTITAQGGGSPNYANYFGDIQANCIEVGTGNWVNPNPTPVGSQPDVMAYITLGVDPGGNYAISNNYYTISNDVKLIIHPLAGWNIRQRFILHNIADRDVVITILNADNSEHICVTEFTSGFYIPSFCAAEINIITIKRMEEECENNAYNCGTFGDTRPIFDGIGNSGLITTVTIEQEDMSVASTY